MNQYLEEEFKHSFELDKYENEICSTELISCDKTNEHYNKFFSDKKDVKFNKIIKIKQVSIDINKVALQKQNINKYKNKKQLFTENNFTEENYLETNYIKTENNLYSNKYNSNIKTSLNKNKKQFSSKQISMTPFTNSYNLYSNKLK